MKECVIGGTIDKIPKIDNNKTINCSDGIKTKIEIISVKTKLEKDSKTLSERYPNFLIRRVNKQLILEYTRNGHKYSEIIKSDHKDNGLIRNIIAGVNYLLGNGSAGVHFYDSTVEKIKDFWGLPNKDGKKEIGPGAIGPNLIKKILETNFQQVDYNKINAEKQNQKLNLYNLKAILKNRAGNIDRKTNYCSMYIKGLLITLANKFQLQLQFQYNFTKLIKSHKEITDSNNNNISYYDFGKIKLVKYKYGKSYHIQGDALDIFNFFEKIKGYNTYYVNNLENILEKKRKNFPQIFDIAVREVKRKTKKIVGHRFAVYLPPIGKGKIKILDYYYPITEGHRLENIQLKTFDYWFSNFKKINFVNGDGSAKFIIVGKYNKK